MDKGFLKLVLVVLCIFINLKIHTYKVRAENLSIKVDKSTGDIIWSSKSIKARSDIRWQVQGYIISLEETKIEDIGYPLKRFGIKKKIYVDNKNVSVKIRGEGIEDGVIKYDEETIISGEYLKRIILEDKNFYNSLKKNYKKGKIGIYLDVFFETYEVVRDKNLTNKIISLHKRENSRYVEYLGSRYQYDEDKKIVKKIRKSELTDIDKIRRAEAWSEMAKKQWLYEGYYNNLVLYDIDTNLRIRYVDEDNNLIGIPVNFFNEDIRKIYIGEQSEYNPHYEFDGDVDKKLVFKKGMKKHFGDKVIVELPITINDKPSGDTKKYTLISSYYIETGNNKNEIRYGSKASRQEITLGANIIEVVGRYRIINNDEIQNEYIEEEIKHINPRGIIGSNEIGREEFDVTVGIPSSEYYYKRVVTKSYIFRYRFRRRHGSRRYNINSYIDWKLIFYTDNEDGSKKYHEEDIRGHYNTEITREYSFWTIENLEIYAIEGANIYNRALKDNNIIKPIDYSPPQIDCMVTKGIENHIETPKEFGENIYLGSRVVFSNIIPDHDIKSLVEANIGELRVRNDRLIIDGRVIMSDIFSERRTKKPRRFINNEEIADRVLYEHGKKIGSNIENGIYESSGSVTYNRIYAINPTIGSKIELEIEDVNQVIVHTPVVCDFKINDSKEWCQLNRPMEKLKQLVLGKDFSIEINTSGRHLDIKGYGYRDYIKYISKKEIIFPFDIYYGGRLYKEGEGVIVTANAKFTLPQETMEGIYEIKLRTTSINSTAEKLALHENYANLNIQNYVAENTITVEVSGRILDFTIEKIKNTSLWGDDRYKLKNIPLIEGDNSYFINEGSFKKGYGVGISVTTIGDYYREIYGVEMPLSFYHYDKATKKRIAVDVYYEEYREDDGKRLALTKLGSKKDANNLHYIGVGNTKIPVFTYSRILFPRLLLKEGSNFTIQRWYGEYSLPLRVYVCKKGYNLNKYLEKNKFLDFNESFWIKKGYLIVSAEIYALSNKKRRLSYINLENSNLGYLNNWKHETENRKKISKDGSIIDFKYGDLFVYSLDRSIWEERRGSVSIKY